MSDAQINLIKRDVRSMGEFSRLEEVLRIAALWSLAGLFVAGLIIGGLFLILRSRTQQAEEAKVRIVREINTQSAKEGLLLSLKDRIGIAGKALDAAKPWGKLFAVLGEISNAGTFSSISIDETGRVNTALELVSLDDAVSVIGNLMVLSSEKALRTPQMLSFALKDDGAVQLSISFFPIF